MATVVCPRCELHTTEDPKRPGVPGGHFCAPDEDLDLDALYSEQNRAAGQATRWPTYSAVVASKDAVQLTDRLGRTVVFDWSDAVGVARDIVADASRRGLLQHEEKTL